ncbi:MAG: sigma 54-interacting transcriptional regulator [Candidatus Eisenbacteria bacterium]
MARKRPDIKPDLSAQRGPGEHGSPNSRESAVSVLRMGQFYLESDSYSDAMEYLKRVDEDALRSQLSDAEVVTLYAGLARCCLGLGRHDEARGHAEKVATLAARREDPVSAAEADVILAKTEGKSGRFRKSLRAAERAYAVLRKEPDSALLAEASKALGAAHAELGNMTAARDCLIDCLVCNRRLGNEEGVAGAYNNLGILAKRSGDLSTAIDYFERSLEIDRRLGRPAAIARRLNNLGVALYRYSRWSEAEENLKQAWEIYTHLGAARDIVAVESALGNLCRVRRNWRGAREYFTRVLRTSQKEGYRRAEALAFEFLGDLERDQGRFDEALRALDQALACAHRLSSVSDVIGEVLRRRAEVYLALGRLDDAERDCTSALDLCRKIGDRLEEGAALRVLAAVSYAKSERSDASVLSARAERLQTRNGDPFALAMTALTDGIGMRLSGRVDGSVLDIMESRLCTAEQLFESIGAHYWVARCSLERTKALHAAGNDERCRVWLEKARPELQRVGDEIGLAELVILQRELDAELAERAALLPSRYSVLADASLLLRTSARDPAVLHGFAMAVADEVSADRVVVFRQEANAQPRVVTSFGRTGRRLAEVRRLVRSAVGGGSLAGPFVSAGKRPDAPMARRLAAVALIPAETYPATDQTLLLYADRLNGDGAAAFSRSDVEFLGASARLLADTLREGLPRAFERSGGQRRESPVPDLPRGFITRDPVTAKILASVTRLCDSTIPILMLGESGVGKDILARAVHDGSSRTGRLVALNSGAVPPHLQESELFGHVRGAFTDADRDRAGLIESASNGTLFLDEIGDMSAELQVKLLRFLQSGEYRRVGDSAIRTSNARVVSATNKDLHAEVLEGGFRRDLFYRLSAFTVEIPPLRERPCDIVPLMRHFLATYAELEGKEVPGFSDDVVELFQHYDWAGNNVRELENEVRRCVALCAEGEPICLDQIRPELVVMREAILASGRAAPGDALSLKDEVEALEQGRIRDALARHSRSKLDAARSLGMSRTGLYTKMRKYGME